MMKCRKVIERMITAIRESQNCGKKDQDIFENVWIKAEEYCVKGKVTCRNRSAYGK